MRRRNQKTSSASIKNENLESKLHGNSDFAAFSKGYHLARARPVSDEFQTAEQKIEDAWENLSKSEESTASRLFSVQDDFFIAAGQHVAQVGGHSP